MSVGVLLDEGFVELSKESFGASDGNIYLRKNNPLSGEFSGVRLGLLNEDGDEFDFYVNSISVFETVDSMTNFRPLTTEVVTVESSEQAMEYELLEYDYTFDNPEDDISVASIILDLDEGDGYELKERYKSNGSLFDPENIPNADILEYEMVIVAEFEPGFFIERDDIKLDIKFRGSPAEENEFEFKFERQQRLNVYQDYQVNSNNELILFDGKLKTNNAIKFNYDFASDSETLIDQITDIEFISLDGGVSDVAFEYESKLYSPQELYVIQQSVQADGGDMEFYLVVLSEDEFLEFQAIKISLESGEKFFIENGGEPFSFILNEKQPVKQTKETLNEE